MKPVSLRLQAFGSYLAEQEIRFDGLERADLFLLCGDTGAGKSTLLDAICFALYGERALDGGRTDILRSQGAAAELPTFVELEFAHAGLRYRARRSPAYERPKLRGQGTVTTQPTATLERIGDGGDEMLAEGTTEVTEQVQRLLNLEAAQFRRLVVLPQGQYEQVLIAKGSEREALLGRLFGNEAFDRLAEVAGELAREAKEACERVRTELASHLAQVGVADVASLEGALSTARDARVAATGAADQARAARDAAQARLLEARVVAERLQRLAGAMAELEAARAHAATLASATDRLALAERAERLRPQLDRATACAQAEGDAAAELKATERRHAEAVTAQEQVRADADRLPTMREELSARRRRVAEIDETLGRIAPYLAARGDVERATKALEAARELVRERDATLQEIGGREAALEEALETLEGVGERLAEAKAEHDALKQATKRSAELQTAVAAQKKAEKAEREAKAELEAAKQRQKKAEEKLSKLLARQLKFGASDIARELEEGEPCPVCGSTKHPSPARRPRGSAGDDAEREALEAEVEDARGEVAEAEEAWEVARQETGDHRETVAGLTGALGERKGDSASELQRAEKKARAAVERLKKDEGLRKQHEKERKELRKERKSAEESLGDAREDCASAESAHGAANVRLAAARAALGDATPDEAKLRTERDSAERAATTLAARIADVEERAKMAAERLAAAASVRAERTERAAKARDERGRADEALRLALDADGWESPEALRRAMMSADDRAALAAELEEARTRLATAEAVHGQAEAAAAGAQLVDLDALEREAAERTTAADAAVACETEAAGRVTALEALAERAAALGAEDARLAARAASVNRVAELLGGKVGRKVSFSRFRLGQMLDQVLESASVKLGEMTDQRYRLQRSDEGGGRGGAGLEIEVLDGQSGKARKPGSLSGGERFMASLSLALGLAEQVSMARGGVRLDTLLVDEGFGSLDPEALDAAVGALQRLAGHGRMVGVISHVAELQERIPAQVRVRGGVGGSRVEVRVG